MDDTAGCGRCVGCLTGQLCDFARWPEGQADPRLIEVGELRAQVAALLERLRAAERDRDAARAELETERAIRRDGKMTLAVWSNGCECGHSMKAHVNGWSCDECDCEAWSRAKPDAGRAALKEDGNG